MREASLTSPGGAAMEAGTRALPRQPPPLPGPSTHVMAQLKGKGREHSSRGRYEAAKRVAARASTPPRATARVRGAQAQLPVAEAGEAQLPVAVAIVEESSQPMRQSRRATTPPRQSRHSNGEVQGLVGAQGPSPGHELSEIMDVIVDLDDVRDAVMLCEEAGLAVSPGEDLETLRQMLTAHYQQRGRMPSAAMGASMQQRQSMRQSQRQPMRQSRRTNGSASPPRTTTSSASSRSSPGRKPPPPSATAQTGFNAAHQTGPAAASRGAPQKKRVTVRGSVRALRPTVSVHRGCPTVTCWGASVRDKCEKVGILLGGLFAYTFVAAVIIFGALGISKAMASTEVEGGWLTFVSILLCVLLFGLCGASWTCAADEKGHEDATGICLGGWGISCLCACILSAVIVHPLDELHLVESAGEPIFDVPALLNSSHDATLRQQIESAGEIEFAPGAYLDLSLAWPVVEGRVGAATVVTMCMAPVLKACGSGALVSSTKCAEVSNICTARGQAPPTCRPSVSSGFVPASYPNYREKDCENNKCGRCEGDCDNDDECATGLRCFQRDMPTQQIPGCTGYNPDDNNDDNDDDF
eukprot:COSAG01_NODE_1944_length_8831_cov_18.803023_5_plen_583_part_00